MLPGGVVMDLWNEGMYERLASVLEPVHDELFERLAPQPGEHWLDLGSGTGAIALRAARAGATVVAIDSSAPLLDKAGRTPRPLRGSPFGSTRATSSTCPTRTASST